jgi:hypothetical protein
MKSLARPVVVLALAVSMLTACGGSGSDDKAADPSPHSTASGLDAKPADGDTISTDYFTYTVPKDWKESPDSGAITLAIDTKDPDGFADNINVVKEDSIALLKGEKVENVEKAVEQVLEDANATGIAIKDPVQVDGEKAVHVGAVFDLNGTRYRTEQYAFAHDETGYVVTLSFSPDVPTAERDKVSESILATWRWTS